MPALFVPVFGAVLPFVPVLAALELLLMDVEANRSRITPVDAGAREGRDSTAATTGIVRFLTIITHNLWHILVRDCGGGALPAAPEAEVEADDAVVAAPPPPPVGAYLLRIAEKVNCTPSGC